MTVTSALVAGRIANPARAATVQRRRGTIRPTLPDPYRAGGGPHRLSTGAPATLDPGGPMKPTRPNGRPHHPAVLEHQAQRAASLQLRLADAITAFAGSMQFVYLHIAVFA